MAPTCVIGILTTALRCGTQWNVSQCDVSYVQTVVWVTCVRSVSTSVYLMLWSLHLPVQRGTRVLSSTSACRDGTKPDGNNTTTRPHHPYILCRLANFAHHKTLCTLVYPHPVHSPHFTHTNTALHSHDV